MGLLDDLRAASDDVIGLLGDGLEVELRRPRDVHDRISGEALTSMELAAAAGAGASTLRLVRPNGDPLAGALPSGLSLSIAGDATEYELAAGAEADDDEIEVSIEPPLVAAAVAGAVVTLGDFAVYTYPAAEVSIDLADVPAALIDDVTSAYALSPSTGQPAPRSGDVEPGVGRSVLYVSTVRPGGVAGGVLQWVIYVGGAP